MDASIHLRESARRAYERDRVWVALRLALPAGALVLLSMWFPGSTAARLCAGGLLVALSFWLPWRGGPAGGAAVDGLVAGILPFGLPLLSHEASCGSGLCQPACMVACVAGGLGAGAWLGLRAGEQGGAWLAGAGTLALLAGTLGCSCIGWGGMGGMAAGLVVGMMPVVMQRQLT